MFACSRRRRAGRAGTSALETALVMLPFLLLLIGTTDVARYLFTLQSIEFLAVSAARAGMASPSTTVGSSGSCPTVSSANLSSLHLGTPAFLDPATTLCVLQNTAADGGHMVTVTVTSPFTSYMPFTAAMPGLSALTGATAMTVTTQLTY